MLLSWPVGTHPSLNHWGYASIAKELQLLNFEALQAWSYYQKQLTTNNNNKQLTPTND